MSFGGDGESVRTLLRLDPGAPAWTVPLIHWGGTHKTFRCTCWSALHFPFYPERGSAFFFPFSFFCFCFCFWLWGGILSAVMLSNAYFKMHESTLIWNELFILWFLNILLLQCLPSWSNWKVQSWMWHRINKNQGFLLHLRVLRTALPQRVEVILKALISSSFYRPF